MKRVNRLSRSRDFDAVYRQGRSVSTRFLVLYWFRRGGAGGDPRLGLAVPKAVGAPSRVTGSSGSSREIWHARARPVPAGRDYVLIVRPGFAEAAPRRTGFDWLARSRDEVLGEGGRVRFPLGDRCSCRLYR